MATPQREAYQLPSQREQPSSATSTGTAAAAVAPAAASSSSATAYRPSYGSDLLDPSQTSVTYTCGECACKVALNLGDAIRCKECGHRVLYKERTKRMVQFEAR